jgi:hypothetical protein
MSNVKIVMGHALSSAVCAGRCMSRDSTHYPTFISKGAEIEDSSLCSCDAV